jgi:intein/homing endonuclease
MADYPITDIILDTEKQDLKESWNSFLNEQLRYRPFQIEIGLDYYTYGNALVSIFYPFVKMLRCTRCGFEKQASDAIYRFMNFEFHWQCEQCDHAGIAKVRDHYIKAPKGIRLLRWNPEDIDIRYNDISGEYEYYYSIPVQLKNDIIIGKKSAVESVPQLFIDALRLRKAVVFSRDNIYHFKRPTLAGKDRGWGTPMILPVLKDTFYLQVLRKAQECVSLTTQIETTKGLVDADEVHVGELVRTHTGKWQPVEKKWYRDAREEEVGKKISLSGLRPFPSTYSPHHPILSIRRTEENRREDSKDAQISSVILRNPHLYEEVLCPAEQLHVGEYVLYPRYLPMGETTVDVAKYTGLTCTGDWVYSGVGEETAQAFEALEHGEHVQHDNAGRVAKRALKEGRSPKRMEAIRPMTEDFAYILGWYAGDGSCGSRSVMFSLGKDDDPNPLRETIKREFGVETTVEVGESVDTVVLSDVIVRHLIKGLIPGTARHKKAPQEVLNGTDAVKLAYLRGLWAADGSDSGTQATLATGSRDQAYDVYRLLLHLGCIATVGQHETPDHTLDSGRVIKGGTHYHAQSSSASRDRFVSLLEGSQGQEVVSGKSGFFWKEYFASRIHMIEESEEDQYIDFKIKEDTTFCTPGTATKNSIAMEHIVPLRMLFPQAGSATSDPYTTVNLQDWHDQIAGELRRWRCVTPDSFVETINGLQRAGDVGVGDQLKNRYGIFETVTKRHERQMDDGESAYRLKVRGQHAIDTVYSEEHPIWAAKKINNGNGHKLGSADFIPVSELTPGDYVGYPTVRLINEVEKLDLAEYVDRAVTEEWVYIDHTDIDVPAIFEYLSAHGEVSSRNELLEEHGWGLNSYKCAQAAIREGRTLRRVPRYLNLDQELAWVLGLYAAEGNTTVKGVFFSLHKDETAFVDKLDRFFASRFGASKTGGEKSENGIQIAYPSIVAAQFFHSLIPGTAINKRLPDVIRHATDDIAVAAVNGVLDGDGSYYEDKTVLGVSSRQLAEDTRQLMLSWQVMPGISFVEGQDVTICGKKTKGHGCYLVQVSGDSHKQLSAILAGETYSGSTFSRIGLFREGFAWFRIEEVAKVEADTVVAFQMDGDSTFCTWGVATHNSDNNYIPILPLPIGQETIGGDGRALLLSQEIRVWSEHIVAGMGVPNELIFGGLSYCQSPDTLLFTSHGLETLEELTPIEEGQGSSDRKVVSHLGIRDVVRTHNVGSKKAAWAKTRLGLELTGAHTHPVYVLQPDLTTAFKTMEELKPGDRVAVKAGANLWPKDVPKIDFQTTNTGNRFEDVTFPRELTPELARLLGYIVAEGSCTESRRIGFGNSDQEVNTDFADCVESVFGYRPKFWPNLSMATCTKPFYQTEISRQQATEFLYSLGIGGYAEEKTVPKIIRCAPKHLVAEFLKAYFEGDGGPEDVEDKQSVTACSKSGRLLQEIQLLMLNMGIVTSRYFPGARPLFVLQARSEHVDLFAKEIGFVSSYKKRILSQRTPTKGSSCLSAHIPYLKERLEEFRDRHFAGRSSWKFEPIEVELTQETYTVDDIAAIVDRDRSTIQLHIQSGALKATKQPPVQGRFGPYIIEKQDLEDFFKHHGLGRRRTTPKSFWGMNYEKLARKDLSFIQEKEPEFAKRITDLVESHLIWDEVQDIDLLDVEIPMRDLTVDEASTYQGNGIISHNSGSNVSLRMLENMFLGYLSDQLSLLRWVIDRTASYLSWPKVGARFKPFKMADDLQRKAYLFQLNQAGKMSDESLMADADYDSAKEDKIMEMEASRRVAAMKKQRLLQAEMEGEAALVTAKWQNKAQAKAMVEQAAIQTEAAKEQMSFQSEMQNGMMQDQAAAQTGQPAPQKSPDLTPTPRNPALISPPKEITSRSL